MKIYLSINENNINSDFKRIANELMNHWILKIELKAYRIAEIEFYLKCESHNDIYTHGHKLQLEKERWYFHGSGLDLTFGSENFHGSILIRALYDINEKKYIYGPINCVTELFSNLGNIYQNNFSFGLIPAKENDFELENPIAAPRVGLNPEKDKNIVNSFYRFLIMPKQKHTDKSKIAEAMKKQKYSDLEIKNIWG